MNMGDSNNIIRQMHTLPSIYSYILFGKYLITNWNDQSSFIK